MASQVGGQNNAPGVVVTYNGANTSNLTNSTGNPSAVLVAQLPAGSSQTQVAAALALLTADESGYGAVVVEVLDSNGNPVFFGLGPGNSVVNLSGTSLAAGAGSLPTITVTGGAGAQTVIGGANPIVITAGTGPQFLVGGSGGSTIFGGSGDTIFGGSGPNQIYGGAADAIFGSTGPSTIYGGAGDTIQGVSSEVIYGAQGNLIVGGSGTDTMFGSTGDTILGGTGYATIHAEAGGELVGGAATGNIIYGGPGDTIVGGAGTDLIYATAGGQLVIGGTGAETIVGGSGNTIVGGASTTQIDLAPANGGASGETIEEISSGVSTAAMTVTGWQAGDAISFTGESATTINSVIASATVTNGNTVLKLPDGSSITLVGITTPTTNFFA
jgi:large repetitive protein